MGVESAEQIERLIALYRASHYEVETPSGDVATIRVGRQAPAVILRWIGARERAFFATACNPRSESLPASENDERLERLRRQVGALGGEFLEGAGTLPGEDWREVSLLVAGIDDAALDALAREHEQNAIVVVSVNGAARLRIYRPEWQGAVGDAADIEWTAPPR